MDKFPNNRDNSYFQMIKIPNMLMLGSTNSNAGKTTLACKVIEKLKDKHNIVALKVTVSGKMERNFPMVGYEIVEETDASGGKDTNRLLKAGSKRVFWFKTSQNSLRNGFIEFMNDHYKPESLIVCESTSLRRFVEPGVFVLVRDENGDTKTSAREVIHLADRILANDEGEFNEFVEKLAVVNNEWRIGL